MQRRCCPLTLLALTLPLQGYLLPFYHQHYWVGLRASMPFAFRWVDPYSPAPASDTYQNWGTVGTRVPEPNNLLGWVLQLRWPCAAARNGSKRLGSRGSAPGLSL